MTRCTVSGNVPDPNAHDGAPTDEKRGDGQYKDHYILCATERAKGFVRPVRDSYRHVGIAGPEGPIRDLTAEEKVRWDVNYAKYEEYGPDHPHKKRFPQSSAIGHFWSQSDLDKIGKGCGTVTTMPMSIAETYAREPGYYGTTFCCGCHAYLRVGRQGEFVWTGTDERVGT